MQWIDPRELSMREERPIPYDGINDVDSSDEDLDNNPDEDDDTASIPDEPPPPRPTRRERMENDPIGFQEKIDLHDDLMQERRASRRERRENNSALWGDISTVPYRPPAAYDPDDAFHKDYIISDFMSNGDLASLIWRLLDQNETTIPNRVLWSFWLCRKLRIAPFYSWWLYK